MQGIRDWIANDAPYICADQRHLYWTNIRQSEPIGITGYQRDWRTFWRW